MSLLHSSAHSRREENRCRSKRLSVLRGRQQHDSVCGSRVAGQEESPGDGGVSRGWRGGGEAGVQRGRLQKPEKALEADGAAGCTV